MRKAEVFMGDILAGWLVETTTGYEYIYDEQYRSDPVSRPISRTLPLQEMPFKSKTMFAFFDGLIPEGWLLEIAEASYKLNPRDRMGLLLACCRDCIGAVSVHPVNDPTDEL
ncbi:HipA N-terminal domain-containing protein [Paraflavitalea pollutisoli]|uniref:HipA N-terminal domain-containing protein n=1 Tax=Paraflavitalea pollutisoli TaxID=3034143 RepID=UPI0023EB546B|nr:HipA N-terminal domain-containing protein [Paraflavitalea sp. H1-2-19X]